LQSIIVSTQGVKAVMTSGLVVDTLVTSPTAPTDNPIFITFNVERLETVVVIPRSSTVGDMIVRQHLIGCPSIAQFVFEGRHFAFSITGDREVILIQPATPGARFSKLT
jgi:hypothetical protein